MTKQPRDNRSDDTGPLRAVDSIDLAGSPVVLVEGLADVDGIADLAGCFGDEDLGFRRGWEWETADDGQSLENVTLDLVFGRHDRAWEFGIAFDGSDRWVMPALVTIASGQLFSLADPKRLPRGEEGADRLILPLMLDLDPGFLAAVGAATGEGPMEMALVVHAFDRQEEAEQACSEAATLIGPLGFLWRLQDGNEFVLVAVGFSRDRAESADRALMAGGGMRITPSGPLRAAIEARLWPGVEEAAAEAAGAPVASARGALLLTAEGGFAPMVPLGSEPV